MRCFVRLSGTRAVRWASSLALAAACTPGSSGKHADMRTPAAEHADRYDVSGMVVDLAGQPVVDMFVTVSTEFCIPDRTDDAGGFTVGDVDGGDKRLITYGETAANGLFASVVFAFSADQSVNFDGQIVAPSLDESWLVDPDATGEQRVVTSHGLELTIPAGSLSLAPFAPDEVQVARVPTHQAPPFVPDGVTLVDLFALHPILSTLDPPAPVAFPGDTGLMPGSSVTFHSLDYDLGLLVPVATGTVDADGRPATDPGQGLPELTWVGVSTE
ncbi:MAG: hypothetical protein ACI8PZ_002013 [Myxococcota bacterium]|jgi:hypothetical protein